MSAKRYHTTHQVAKLLGVSLPTVVNWVDKGLLDAHRTPGGHRRIGASSLVSFARKHNYPLTGESVVVEGEGCRVLLIDDDRDSSETVREYLKVAGNIHSAHAESPVEAGYQLARFTPEVVLLRMQIGGINSILLGQQLMELAKPRPLRLVAWSDFYSPDLEKGALQAGFVAFLTKPIQLDAMLTEIRLHLLD